jgi:hypothetical protein
MRYDVNTYNEFDECEGEFDESAPAKCVDRVADADAAVAFVSLDVVVAAAGLAAVDYIDNAALDNRDIVEVQEILQK